MKLQLPQVTLLIYNPDKDSNLSAKVLNFVCSMIDFGAVKHLCSVPPTIECVGETVIVENGDWEEGQIMQSYLLNDYFDTEFLLHVETDGYPVNVHLWEDDFLNYDYIAAPWPTEYTVNNRVGNGGCSLSSKKFRQFMYDHREQYIRGLSSDIFFCQYMYPEAQKALKFAPLEVAQRFSFELPVEELPGWDWKMSFGYHGKFDHLKEPLSLAEEHYIESALDKLETPELKAKRKQVARDLFMYGQARIKT